MYAVTPGCKETVAEGSVHRAKRDGGHRRAVAAGKPETHMLFADHIGELNDKIGHNHQRLSIARPERTGLRDFLDQRDCCSSGRQHRVDLKFAGVGKSICGL